jgi:hypothetical protein
MMAGWRKLYNEELHNLHSSPIIITNYKSRRIRWVQHVARTEEKENVYKILVHKLEGKIPLGKFGRRSNDNFKMDLREIGWNGLDWFHLAEDRNQ